MKQRLHLILLPLVVIFGMGNSCQFIGTNNGTPKVPAEVAPIITKTLESGENGQFKMRVLRSKEISVAGQTEGSFKVFLIRAFIFEDRFAMVEVNTRRINLGMDSGYVGIGNNGSWEFSNGILSIDGVGTLKTDKLDPTRAMLLPSDSNANFQNLPLELLANGIPLKMEEEWLSTDGR